MIKRYGDIVAGAVFLALTALYCNGTFLELKFKLSKYGAEFVPRIYCLIMAAVSVALIIRGVLNLRKNAPEAGAPVNRAAVVRVVLTILLIAGYCAVLSPAGFIVSTMLYLALQVLITVPRGKVRPLSIVLFAAGVTCTLNYLFLHVFYLSLPPGILSF